MLRASSYTIYVPLPDSEEEMLLVHGYTGAYDRVSRSVASYVRSLEVASQPKPLYGEWVEEPAARRNHDTRPEPPTESTIEILRRRGYLTEKTVDQETGYLARLTKRVHARQTQPGYIIMPTYSCNLRCAYCFQDHMRTNPQFSHLLRIMTPEMVDRIIAAMPTIESQHGFAPGKGPRRNITFFGGEPLLAENRPVIARFIEKLRALGPVNFTAISNGTELEAYEDLLGPDGISALQITLDGPMAEHDRRRIYADGSGSFDRIARNVDMALERGAGIAVRMNIDRKNIDLLPILAEFITARGWDTNPRFSCYTAPVHPSGTGVGLPVLKATYFNSWELDNAIDDLRAKVPVMRVVGRPDDVMVSRARKIFGRPASSVPELKTAFCGAHTGMYIFDAFGDIYACWEKTGDANIRIGRVLEDGEVEMNDKLVKMWRKRTPASNPTCRKCRYALHCGGGCAVLAEGQTGKIHSNYCDAFGDRFRHAVATAYTSFANGVAVAEQERVCDM